ncbi:glycerophosphodiester phosphodiesterase [Larkinella arboricola]
MLRIALASLCFYCFAGLFFQSSAQSTHLGITAHRGNSTQFPENTLPAFKSALSLGVDWVELDVYKTKDGKLVVLHDATTGRVGNQNLDVAQSTYDQLKKVDVATDFRKRTGKSIRECPPQTIPLLEDALKLFAAQSKTRVSIQPKTDCVAEAIALVRKNQMEKKVGFNDGNLAYMANVKKLAPAIPVFWDRPANTDIREDIRIAKEHGFESLVINEKGLTEEKINQLKIAGIEPGVWTVNERDDLIRFLDMGVARIYTDDPALLIDLKKVHQTVVCEGAYEVHLQGICTDQKSSIYWSWTTAIVRTDMQGKILASVAAPSHQGDLCYHNGKLYVAVNLGEFNKPAGEAKSWVYEYDALSLKKLNEYPVPELVHGAGGMEYNDGKFMIVGGLVPGINENYVYEYDEKFRFIRRHTVASGYTLMGIQTIAYANGTWWLGCYGKPAVTLRTDDTYRFQGQTVFDASLGIAPYSSTHLWIGSNVRLPGQGHVGRVRLVEIEKIAK